MCVTSWTTWHPGKLSMDETMSDISVGLYLYAYMIKLYVTTELHDMITRHNRFTTDFT